MSWFRKCDELPAPRERRALYWYVVTHCKIRGHRITTLVKAPNDVEAVAKVGCSDVLVSSVTRTSYAGLES